MKKSLSLILAAVMALLLLASCGATTLKVDVNEAAEVLKNDLSYAGSMEELTENMLESTYEGIDVETIASFKAYISADATAEEIAVFELKDEGAAKAMKAAMDERIISQKEIYSSYSPEGAARLDKGVVKQAGKYVILCVSDDTDKIATVVNGLLG
ncbi:MAG: DUF4358 domain-containing protein [Oscillospiraceae bacterium]|nr:DUF4358 domain-containing protein [Oscillospiraceae bacterium]